jgi:hypothetical protein
MPPAVETERDRLRANMDAFARLLQLAERLRRTNTAKWGMSREEWLAAAQAVLNAPEARHADTARITEAIRLAHGVVRRLADSGEARLCSLTTGRHPDSSLAGQRFYKDLELAQQRLVELRELDRTEQGAAADRPRD